MLNETAAAHCAAWRETSPENARFAWCAKFKIHLDHDGRFCRRCQREPEFLAMLKAQATARFGPDCAMRGSYCQTFQVATDAAQCQRCATDPLFRAFLRGQRQAAATAPAPAATCVHRGEKLGTEKRPCCGGRLAVVEIFHCAKRGRAHLGVCAACELAQSSLAEEKTC